MDGWNGGGMNEWVRGGEEFGFVAMNGGGWKGEGS